MYIDHDLSYVKQSTNNTCWAASTAMMMDRPTDMEIVSEMQNSYPDSVWTDGATDMELGQVAKIYGLEQVYPVCQGPEGWFQWLSDNGPMLIAIGGTGYHSIVVAGIRGGDDDLTQTCEPVQVHVLDPWHGDVWVDFEPFTTAYELGSGFTNNVFKR